MILIFKLQLIILKSKKKIQKKGGDETNQFEFQPQAAKTVNLIRFKSKISTVQSSLYLDID